MRVTLATDARRGVRVDRKEHMTRRRYQEGSLFTRGRVGRKVWVARWREDMIGPDGGTFRMMRSQVLGKVANIPTKREARQLLSSLLLPTNQGLRKPQATLTFAQFTSKWEAAVLPTYRPSTRYFYRNILQKHLVPKFAPYRLCDIHGPDVQMFLNQKAQRYAPTVLHHIRATLSRVYATAKEWGYVESNPASSVRLAQGHAVRPKVIFKPSEVETLMHALKEPYRTMILVAAVTGMRVSELLALQWSDVDFERRLLYIRRAYYRGQFGPPKNRASERAIPIPPGIWYALKCLNESGRRSSMDLVFPNAAGNPHDAGALLNRVLYPTLTTLGLPRTGWRAFRRSAATALSEMREPVRTTQQVLGHSSPQTTLAFYVQSVEESQRRAISSLEKILFPNVPKFEEGAQLSC